MVATGSGAVHSSSTTNCAAPEKTRALIEAASTAPRPACPARVPNTRPIAKPLIAIGTHLLAPASAPERVNVTGSSVSPLAVTISQTEPNALPGSLERPVEWSDELGQQGRQPAPST